MGIELLNKFLEINGLTPTINIGNKVKRWEEKHPNQPPTIVIDFPQFKRSVMTKKREDKICGGRPKTVLNVWETILKKLKNTGCKLVFYSDYNLQKEKINEWLRRKNGDYGNIEKIYQMISEGKDLKTIVESIEKTKISVPLPASYGMEEIAQEHGEFHYAVKYECDRELAMYANDKKAMAIMSDDTDFCIFQGSWKLWSVRKIDISESNKVKTIEYNREGFAIVCKISSYQLPLLGTLAGNDLINKEQLVNFYKKMDIRNCPAKKFKNLGVYVRKNFNNNLDPDIRKISRAVFGKGDNKETQSLIRQSIESYNTKGQLPIVESIISINPMLNQLLASTRCTVQKLSMPYYDFGCGVKFPNLLKEWLKRRMGLGSILLGNRNGDSAFTLLTMEEKTQLYKEYEESKMYPDQNFEIPGKDQLYQEADTVPLEKKLEILGWIMSLSKEEIFKIKSLEKFWLTVTILCIMVKNELIGKEEADGILYTENCVQNKETANVEYPTVLFSKFVRAAHMYNVTFGHVRDCFDMAGLLSHIQRNFQFDGVFFQKHMEEVGKMNATQREHLYKSIEEYRIYA